MQSETSQLRAALRALYHATSNEERHAADAWLRAFAGQPASWDALVALLGEPSASAEECLFASTLLARHSGRHPAAAQADGLQALAPLLARQLARAAAAGWWQACGQLAAALATLAARSPGWPEAEVLPRLLALASAALAEGGLAHEAAQLALLRLLAALPQALWDGSMHPWRLPALRAALADAPQPLALAAQALAPGAAPAAQAAALQLLQAWCSLGAPPAGAERCCELWRQLHCAALRPELGAAAAEALAALYGSCGADGDAGDGPEAAHRRRRLLAALLQLLPGFGADLRAELGGAAHHPQQQARQLFAALALLGAAARAAASWVGEAAGAEAPAAEAEQLAAEVALAALQHASVEAALAALQLWDELLERWGDAAAAAAAAAGGADERRRALAGRLAGVLLQRLALPLGLQASADARDLPGDVRQVRREAADTFRGAADWLGAAATRHQLLQLAAEAAAAGDARQEECSLFALNLVWGRQRGGQPPAEAAAEAAAAAGAVAAALRRGGPKLAGTALTLLGGMGEQLAPLLGEPPVPRALEAAIEAVRQRDDEKLSRNAASCWHRLCGCRPLAAALAARQPHAAQQLCACFEAGGGMQQPPRPGQDLATPQLLLSAVCRLAAAAADAPGAAPQHSAALLERLMAQPAAAADAALAAAAAAPPGSEPQQAALGAAAVQLETLAAAAEALHGSAAAPHLPRALGRAAAVLQRAAAAAAQPAAQPGAQPPLARAVSRLASAVAPTPAAPLGLELLLPSVGDPQHPAVLAALAALATGAGGALPQLPAAAGGCLRAGAATRGGDPEWQPALLALGAACLAALPGVLAEAAALDSLLRVAHLSLRSYHRQPCEAVVALAEALCCVGCPPPRRCAGAGAGAGAGAVAEPAAAAAARLHLRRCVDGGLGGQLLLGLLLAASGAQPPYMVAPIADALHRTWLAVGSDRFGAWLRDAALTRAPEGEAPWRRWAAQAQANAVAALLDERCRGDARRFKRLLKSLCGGKKKGRQGAPPARG